MNPGRIPITVDDQDFEILWQDHGVKQRLILFRDGRQVGSKEVGLMTDDGHGVLVYIVRSILREETV